MLLDTSGILCYFDVAERHNAEAVALFRASTSLLTHSYVLAEFVPLCRARRLDRADSLSFAQDFMGNPSIDIVWVDNDIHRAGLSLLKARLDKTYSLCDAVSFLLMRERGITKALTTDRHFEQEGFVRLLQP
ncbi:MAG: PIN domain-containing protein [Acidobacteriota bacterium]